jgi:DNA polymerase-1
MNNKITLFDLNSHIHRVYYIAKKNSKHKLVGSYQDGKPNYIINGTMNLINKEFNTLSDKSSHLIFVLDDDGKNFRHEIYPEYKANRDPSSKEIVYMRNCIYKLLQMKGYCCIRKKDVEADDVIATIARKASFNSIIVDIHSGDKDLFELIDKNTSIIVGTEKKKYNIHNVIDYKGLSPEKFHDYLTMNGDVADNVIGITHCGTKTSIEILKHYNLEQILENPDLLLNLKIRNKTAIIDFIKSKKEQIILMSKVVRLKDDLNLNLSFKDFKRKIYSEEKINLAYKSIGLSSSLSYGFSS